MKSWEYAFICIDAGCIYGACIRAHKEAHRLGLICVEGRWSLRWVKKNLPVRFLLFTNHRGWHDVLCIDVRKDKLLLANYAWGRLYWLSWKNVKRMKGRMKLWSIQQKCKSKKS